MPRNQEGAPRECGRHWFLLTNRLQQGPGDRSIGVSHDCPVTRAIRPSSDSILASWKMPKLHRMTPDQHSYAAVVTCLLLSLFAMPLGAQQAEEQQSEQFISIRTDSPRQTFETFLQLRDELEDIGRVLATEGNSRELNRRAVLAGEQMRALFDLSSVPGGSRREVGEMTSSAVLDILGRIDLPDPETIPGIDDEENQTAWRIPHTPLRIIRVESGPHKGEYLFSEQAVRDAPRFYRGIAHLPLRSTIDIESWTRAIPQLTGPMIPAGMVLAMPDSLQRVWLDTPIWKVVAVILVIAAAATLIVLLSNAVARTASKVTLITMLRRAAVPLAVLVALWIITPIIAFEINITGTFARIIDTFVTVAFYVATTWLFWLATLAIFQRIVTFRKLDQQGFDTQLILVSGKVVAVFGSVIIVGVGAQELGLPIYSIVAGLGIGGLAVALAIRPTLENLIAGIILYLDQPVRVGDYCSFGDAVGTIESIGIRTTKLRALDRTLVTIPNAALADMQLINWAKCDQMMITSTLGLRYETDPDQLRFILVKIREMLHSHPKIDGETVRVRFAGYGASSLDIGVRVYALTQDWNEYYAICEDVFLRMHDIVRDSGSDFAFPAQTLYMARDSGLNEEKASAARDNVREWRESGNLPFPTLSARRINELAGTLDWPPRGSVNISATKQQEAEPLSADEFIEDEVPKTS